MRWLVSIVYVITMTFSVFSQNNDSSDDPDITPIQALQVFGGSLDTVAFSPDGETLVTGGRDHAVRVWDVETSENTAILAGHSDWISSVVYSPDGTVIASGGRDTNIWLWNVQTETSLRLIEGHQAEIKAIEFTPDGQYLISGSLDGIVRLEQFGNPESTQYFENFGGGVWSLTISPDGTTLAIGSDDSNIWLIGLWDTEGTWLTQLSGHHTPVITMAWSADGATLLSGEQNGHIRLWDVANAKQGAGSVTSTLLEGHLAPVMGVNFTAHEGVAISTALDGTVRLWDIAGEVEFASELTTIHSEGAPLTHLALSNDGTTSASVGTDGTLNIWSLDRDTLDIIIDSQRPVVIVNTQQQNIVPQAVVSDSISPPQENIQPSQPQDNSESFQPLPATSAPTLMIPSVGMQVGIKTFPLDGVSWAIDPWETLVGYLQGTAWVTGNGNMALAGHSLYPDGRAGTFNSLYNVSLGDEIIVQDGDIVRHYIVNDIRVVPYTDISVVYPTAHSRVTLITCDIPSFHAESGLYGERLVVIADAVG
jgi:LPXTG-site transpeptidase (sortase) family protein